MTFKVIIAGTRSFSDYGKLFKICDILLEKRHPDITIVCGMARGADLLGKRYAEEKGYEIVECPADWDNLGKSAGIIRNKDMGNIADALIAFWDYKSHGTKHMIDYATQKGLMVRVIRI